MRTELCFSMLVAAACALPSPAPVLCGPNSNCELVNSNGIKAYKFKSGMEPGSADHKKRFAHSLSARQESSAELRVIMGEMRMQWGCDTDVGSEVSKALDEICGSTAGCDEGQKHSFGVKKWEGNDDKPTDADLNMKLSGKYYDQEVRDVLAKALLATINDQSVETDQQEWHVARSASANNWGGGDEYGDCAIKMFPNYVAVNRFEDGNLRDYMELEAELVEGEGKPPPKPLYALPIPYRKHLSGFFFGFT